MSSQMSIQSSEQGSSDDPDDDNHNDESNKLVRPPINIAGSSYPLGGQDSDAFAQKTGNSGSKRKSTDDSSEQSSKEKRYKERSRKKKAEQDKLAFVGLEIARSMREETQWKMSKDEEIDKCIEKFDEYRLLDYYHDYAMS